MVKKTSKNINLDLTIYFFVKQGLNPTQIMKKLKLTKQRVNYYISSLKKRNLIRKIGYGVWEITGNYIPNKSKNQSMRHQVPSVNLLTPDLVRGHAFIFVFALPNNLRNWDKREKVLARLKIPFKRMNWYGTAQKIVFQKHKIVLTNKSIVIYEKKSFFADNSTESKSLAVSYILNLVKALESRFNANFRYSMGQYRFRISRQHYSLIKNSLAKQYDEEGNQLYIYDAGEPWLVIDNSFNLHELETLHARTADKDSIKVKSFFTGLKRLDIDECDLANRITQLEKKVEKKQEEEKKERKYIG